MFSTCHIYAVSINSTSKGAIATLLMPAIKRTFFKSNPNKRSPSKFGLRPNTSSSAKRLSSDSPAKISPIISISSQGTQASNRSNKPSFFKASREPKFRKPSILSTISRKKTVSQLLYLQKAHRSTSAIQQISPSNSIPKMQSQFQ